MPAADEDTDSDDDISLNDEEGAGEDNMSAFINRLLSSITKPMKRAISDLQSKVVGIDTVVMQVQSSTRIDLKGQNDHLAKMQAELDKMREEVDEVRTCLERTTALETAVPRLESELGRANERHRNLQAGVFELDQELKNNNQITSRLKADMAAFQAAIETKCDSFRQELQTQIDNLAADHDATIKSLRAAEKFQVETRRDLLALTTAFEKQVRRDDGGASRADRAVAKFELMIKNTDMRVQQNTDQIKAAKTSSHTLQTLVEQLHKSHTILEHQHRDSVTKNEGLSDKVDDLQSKVNNVAEALGDDDDMLGLGGHTASSVTADTAGGPPMQMMVTQERAVPASKKDIWGTVSRLQDQLANNTSGIRNLDQLIQVHSDQLVSVDARAAGFETSLASLKETAHKLNESSVKRIGALENMFNHNEQANRQHRERLTQDFSNFKQEANSRFDAQEMELDTSKANIVKNTRESDAAGNRIRTLQGELKATNEDINKLRQTLELTQQYWKGLTKGFKQTRQQQKEDKDLSGIKGSTTLPSLRASGSNGGVDSPPLSGRPSSRGGRKDRTAPLTLEDSPRPEAHVGAA